MSHMTRQVSHMTSHVTSLYLELIISLLAAHGPDLTVAVFLWRCGDSAHQDYIVGVFDLNQYYHSQVPKMLHWQSSGKRSG